MTDALRAESSDSDRTPYVGLVPYGEQDADFFFGRAAETRIVSGNLRASDLTLLYGASGVGKTSLLRAGVIHDLRREAGRRTLALSDRAPFAVCGFSTWRDEPLPALMETIKVAAEGTLGEGRLGSWDPSESVQDALESWTERVRTLLVILDQFEDYFLYHPDEAGPGTFAGELPGIVNDPNLRVHILLSIREDALAKLDRFKGSIPRLFANYVRIEHLSRAAARDAIEGPLGEWNRRQSPSEPPYVVGPGLVDAVIDATATGGVTLVRNGARAETEPDREHVEAPFLQLVMERLWRATASEGSHDLTVERLDRLGGPQRIVENYLLDALGALSPGEQEVAADLFRFLVTSSKTKIAHPASDLEEWTGHEEAIVEPVLDKLCRGESGRILRRVTPPHVESGATLYELYHDVLAEPILDWRREYEQERRRRAVRRRVLRIGSAVLLLIAVISGLGIWALVQRNEARTASRSAASLALASAATEQLPSHVDEALLLALAGYQESPSPDAASAMVESLTVAQRSGAQAILRGDPRGVRAIAWSPDQRTFATADFNGTVLLWDLQERRPVGEPLTGHEDEVWSLAFSPDGTRLASASDDGTVRLWNVDDQAPVGVLRSDDTGVVSSVAWSPDGTMLAAAGEPGSIQLWNPETQKALGPPLEGHRDQVGGLAFSPTDQTLASASSDGTIRFWNVRSRKSIKQIDHAHDGGVLSIAWSPDGKKLVSSGTDGVMRIWNPRTGRSLVQAFGPDTGHIWGVAWSADGRTIASTGEDSTVRLWDARDGTQIGEPLRGHSERLTAVAFAPDGRTLASASYDGTARIWAIPTPAVLGAPLGLHADQVKAVAYNRDGSLLASADFGGTIRLWDMRSRKLRSQLEDASTTSIESLAWSPDGQTLASAGDSIVLWDVADGKPIATLDGHDGAVQSVAWSRDGSKLASAGADSTVRLWDVARRRPLGVLHGHDGTVWSVAWSPNGRTLASLGEDRTLRLWDARTQTALDQIEFEDDDSGTSVAFSPNGDTLATGSIEHRVQLWRVDPLAPLGEPLGEQEREVRAVAFSPDGRRLISAGDGGAMQLWDVQGRHALGNPLRSGNAPVYAVQFSPDGESFASGAEDGAVRLWEGILWNKRADLEDRVCRLVVGNLNEGEWQMLVPGLPYRRSCP